MSWKWADNYYGGINHTLECDSCNRILGDGSTNPEECGQYIYNFDFYSAYTKYLGDAFHLCPTCNFFIKQAVSDGSIIVEV